MPAYFMDIAVREDEFDAYHTISHKMVKADSMEELIGIIEDTYDGVIRNNLSRIQKHENLEKYLKDFTDRRIYEQLLQWLDISRIYEVENEPVAMDSVLELTGYSLKEHNFSSSNQFYRVLKTHPTPKVIPDPIKYETEIAQARKRLLIKRKPPSMNSSSAVLFLPAMMHDGFLDLANFFKKNGISLSLFQLTFHKDKNADFIEQARNIEMAINESDVVLFDSVTAEKFGLAELAQKCTKPALEYECYYDDSPWDKFELLSDPEELLEEVKTLIPPCHKSSLK